MRIFRQIFVLTAIAPALVSCLSSVKQDGGMKTIVFEPVVGTEVRSESTVSFSEDTEIGVWAVTPEGGAFFDREKVICDNGRWVTEKPYLWSQDTRLKFFGYAPYHLDIRYEDDGSLALDDLDISENTGGLFIAGFTPEYGIGDGPVHMTFLPATATMDFRVNNGLNQVTSVRIEKIILCGVYVHGSLHWSEEDTEWTPSGEPADIVAYDFLRDGGDNYAGRDPEYFGKTLDIIPQQSFPVVKVVYSFVNADSEWLPGQENCTEELQAEWEAGRHYTYTLTLTETIVKHTTGISASAGRKPESTNASGRR